MRGMHVSGDCCEVLYDLLGAFGLAGTRFASEKEISIVPEFRDTGSKPGSLESKCWSPA